MKRKPIPISLPATDEREWRALRDPITSGWVTQGPKVAAFEQQFAHYHKVKHAVAVTSCTTGLHLALVAMGVGPGDEVIVPAFTWVATANVVLHCGALPVFVDIDRKTYNIDPLNLAENITEKTKAVIPVHLFGLCADMDAIRAVTPPRVRLLEDAACASGAMYKGKFAGSLGAAAVFSFHPRKIITTGEGGMVTTNDTQLANRLSQLRNHGASISEEQRHNGPQPYILPEFNLLGYNYRMTDLQGAMGLVQLEKLKAFIQERKQWAAYYHEHLSDIKWLHTPTIPAEYEHGWQSYVCFVDEKNSPRPRNKIMEILLERGISTRPGTHAVHMLSFYRNTFGYTADDFPVARDCDLYSMALPLHNQMTEDDYAYVVQEIKRLQK